jgi:hypothetical protein
MRPKIADFDFRRYTVYSPVLRYEHLTPQRVSELLGKCFRRFYFRWQYLRDNAHLLWPGLRRMGVGRGKATATADGPHDRVPAPRTGLDVLARKGLRTDGPHQTGRVSDQAGDCLAE